MQVKLSIDTAAVQEALKKAQGQVPYATMLALNKTAAQVKSEVQTEMRRVFDRPTPWVMNSLRVANATKSKLVAQVAYKDSWSNSAGEVGGKTMIEPHVLGGQRTYKGMEVRLSRAGFLPDGWNVVPGAGASLDAYGNMSRGQISQVLNVLQTYTESGYNKANAATRARLAKGNAKKNVYGFTYWVNPPGGNAQGKHLAPGVYQRMATGFGSSLKPILMFVKRATYKQRLDFYGIGKRVIDRDLQSNFKQALAQSIDTALLKTQGSLL
jgi:hypothetical protein